jgi:phosphoglycerate dehydrogenase-like enzyme
VTAAASSAVPPPTYTAAEIRQIQSQGKDVQITVPANAGELNKLLPEADVIFGALNAEMLAKAKNLRWLQATEGGGHSAVSGVDRE